MPTAADFERFDLTAAELARMTGAKDGVKLVHNLTDRGIIPFRKDGRSRLYSFASLLTFDAMVRARSVGLGLAEGSKLAEIIVVRAKERVANLYIRLGEVTAWSFLIYAFDRECEPPMLLHYVVDGDEKIVDLQVTLTSGWPSDVTSLFPIDRVIWECADAFDRLAKAKQK